MPTCRLRSTCDFLDKLTLILLVQERKDFSYTKTKTTFTVTKYLTVKFSSAFIHLPTHPWRRKLTGMRMNRTTFYDKILKVQGEED